MSYPNAPPPYDDRDPLHNRGYPEPGGYPPPGGYPQPGGYPPGAYNQPGAYPPPYGQPGGFYPQPGYPQPGGYPEPGHNEPPKPVMPMLPNIPLNPGDHSAYETGDPDGQFGSWDSKTVRHAFIRKVYAIITVQLFVTVAIVAVFTFVEPVGTFVRKNPAFYYSSYGVFFVTYIVLACCEGPRRKFPWNIILLAIFTIAMSLMTGTIASYYSTRAVLITLAITAVVTIAVTVFCFQTKVDFTSCTGLFCVLGIVVFVTGIVTAIVLSFKYIYWLHMLYAAIGAIAFTLFLAYDTQLVIGNRKHTISPEEYVYGAMKIYTDIVYIFLNLLQLVGSRT